MINNIYKFSLNIEVLEPDIGKNKIIINSDFLLKDMSNRELCVFIETLNHINNICIEESKKRFNYGKNKNKKK